MLRFLGSVLLCLREDLKEKAGRLKDFCLPRKPITLSFLSFTKKKKKNRARTNGHVQPVYNIFSDNLFRY